MSQSETTTCQSCRSEFVIRPEDFVFYAKIDVPTPLDCPLCRYRRRLLDRNEWSLYRRTCDLTGEPILSIYRPEAPFPVYKPDAWYSDQWDPLVFGRDIDFSRPFFEQFDELRRVVPHLALVSSNSVNSEYSNQSQNNKDCYWVSASDGSEKCMYGNWYQPGNYLCADCYMIEKSELCYECINCGNCYGCVGSQDCFDCRSLWFSIDCFGCSDCFGSVGLRNKQYCWLNEQLTKQEYERRFAALGGTRSKLEAAKEQAANLALSLPRKFYHGRKAENATGDYLVNVEDVQMAFNVRNSEDCAYLQDAWQMKDCLDSTEILQAELSYELQGCAFITGSIALRSCWTVSSSFYCDMSMSLSNCFGCFGLRQKQYCILNKQYTREAYEALVPKLIQHMKQTGEWGQYFPPEQSPFAYNESVAQDFFPLSKEQAAAAGHTWQDRSSDDVPAFTLRSADLPERVADTADEIVQQTIHCRSQASGELRDQHPACTGVYRLIPMELELYRALNVPVPDRCFPCRRTDRFAQRNPRQLWYRMCQCSMPNHDHIERCPNQFETTYHPNRAEIAYCEPCYQKEVV